MHTPSGRARPLRRALRRFTTGATALGVLLLGAPVLVGYDGSPATGPGGRIRDAAGAAEQQRAVELDVPIRLVAAKSTHPKRRIKKYRVRPGDTPSGIAVRYHAWTDELVALNGRTLYAGEIIKIPVVVRAVKACTKHKDHRSNLHRHGTANKGQAVKGKADKAKPAKHQPATKKAKPNKTKHSKPKSKPATKKPAKKKATKKPPKKPVKKPVKKAGKKAGKHGPGWTHAAASRAEVRRVIVRTAERNGVGPYLALAVAWHESGWQQRRVSPAGALGAMQVMPGTGRWMSLVVGRKLHLRDLHENVTAGVVLLKVLRSQARTKVAVAGYYQGLAGVQKYGMYPSTRRYVKNVLHTRTRLKNGWNPA